MNRCWNGVVTTLCQVNVIIGAHYNTSKRAQACDNFIHVHVARGARAGLKNIYRKLVGMLACGRSEEHTSELQSRPHLVCRLLLEKKKKETEYRGTHPTQRHKQNT